MAREAASDAYIIQRQTGSIMLHLAPYYLAHPGAPVCTARANTERQQKQSCSGHFTKLIPNPPSPFIPNILSRLHVHFTSHSCHVYKGLRLSSMSSIPDLGHSSSSRMSDYTICLTFISHLFFRISSITVHYYITMYLHIYHP